MSLLLQIYVCSVTRSLSKKYVYQTDIIEVFCSTSKYLDDLFKIDTACMYFDRMANQIHPTEIQLKKLVLLIPKHQFWIYIYLFPMVTFPLYSTSNGMVLILTFNGKFPIMGDGIPLTPSHGVYI